jgi:signal transduction histidine kinase
VSERARDRLCWLAAVLVLLAGVLVWALGGASVGLRLDADTRGRLVVTDVTTGSLAWSAGAQPGMIAASIYGPLPATTTDVPIGQELRLVEARSGQTLELGSAFALYTLVLPALWGGVVVLVVAWFIRRRYAGQAFAARFVAPLALAATTPLALVAAAAFGSPVTLALGALLWPLSVVPLAAAIAGEAPTPFAATRARRVASAAIVAALGLAPLLYVVPAPAAWVTVAREVLVAMALLGPVVLVTPARLRRDRAWTLSAQPVVRMFGLVAVAATPLVIRLAVAAPSAGIAVIAIALWLATGVFVTRYAVAPLAGLVTRAVRQRDLVAATAEAERRRIAADLHDGPLQSLTLLAYRLDAVGDDENAALARDVMTELRAVTSLLRLPIVDDLGAGPALEWLTTQVGRLSGLDIALERADAGRPPLDVEHAVFRVAQEALANATRHGRPPIRVRYEAGTSRASLTVDDAGPGLLDLPALADGEHGLGLVGMRERAHSIGAALEIAGSSAGSRVSLVWPAAGW